MLRSLKVTNGWLKRVKQALSRYDFSSQKALAEELEISPRKANDFFNGKTVEHEIFVAICTRLELDWQKVAKVSSEPKASPNSTQTEKAIAAPNMEDQTKKSEAIPKLASSLFKTFDSQDRIAQKKFVQITTPTSDFPLIERTENNSDEQSNEQLTDRVQDSHKDLVDAVAPFPQPAIAPPKSLEKSLKSPDSKSKGAEEIHELLGINTNTTKSSSVLNPVSIAQIQELLGMVADIKKPNQPVQAPSPQLSPNADSDETALVTENIEVGRLESINPESPLREIEFTPPLPKLDKQSGKIEISHNSYDLDGEPPKQEVIADIKAEILATFKPEQSLTEIEFSPPKASTQPDRLLRSNLESSRVASNLESDIDLITSREEVETAIAAEIEPFKPALDEVEFSPPISSQFDNLEPILTACHDACEAQDWDMAAAIINGINLTHIKKTADLASILDLYNQLLPLKWQDGEQKISDRPTHWQVIYNAGTVAFYLQKYTDAVNYYETARAIAEFKLELESTDLKLISQKSKIKALNGLGQVYQAVAQYQRAIKYYQQAQTIAKETQDHHAESQALSNLGNIYYVLRQYRTAINYYLEFLQLGQVESFDQNSAEMPIEVEFSTIGNLGNAYYNLGEYQTAISYQQKYLEVAQAIGNWEKEAVSLVSLGFSYYALGLYQTAIAHYQDAKAIADKFAYQRLETSIFSGLGLSYQALKNYSTAVVCFHKCLEVARKVGDRSAEVKALYNLRKANSYQHV